MTNILIILMFLCLIGTLAGLACGLILGAIYSDDIKETLVWLFLG